MMNLRIKIALMSLVLVVCGLLAAMPLVTGIPHPSQGWAAIGLLSMSMPLLALSSYESARRDLTDRVRDGVMPAVCRFVGDLSYRSEASAESLPNRFHDVALVPRFSWADLQGEVEGHHGGTAFRMVGARLGRRNDRNVGPAFVGAMLAIKVSMPFSGRVYVGRNESDRRNERAEKGFMKDGLRRVCFDDPPFEATFRVYANHPADARKLLVPAARDALVTLDGVNRGPAPWHRVVGVFDAGELLLALPRQSNLFEIGVLRRSVYELEADMGRLLSDVTIPQRVIDLLRGDRPNWA